MEIGHNVQIDLLIIPSLNGNVSKKQHLSDKTAAVITNFIDTYFYLLDILNINGYQL